MHLLQSSLKMPTASEFGASNSFAMDTSDDAAPTPLHQILVTSQSGTLALITPISETSYRRLSGLATHLQQFLDSACGLNSKAFRAGDVADGGWDAGTGARGMLDGNLLMRWGELGEQRRRDGLQKWGGDEWVLWGEREVLGGWGLFGRRGQ
tara:strand:+ start:1367 stop:1822 length:456 start_codon:yes stop_codon:yes gene_type:complete